MSLSSRIEALASRIAGEMRAVRGTAEYASAMAAGANNAVLNPMGQVAQEGARIVTGDGEYPVDQWKLRMSGLSGAATQTSPPVRWAGAFRFKSNTAGTPTGRDVLSIEQFIERNRITRFGLGTSFAVQTGIAFLARCDQPGTYTVAIRSGSYDASFLAPFEITEANAYQFFAIPVPAYTAGTWSSGDDTSRGAVVSFTGAAGPDAIGNTGWQSGNMLAVPGQANLASADQQNLHILGVVWAEGADLLTEETLPLAMPPYADDLLACQRYYWTGRAVGNGSGYLYTPQGGSNLAGPYESFPVPMRNVPAMSILDDGNYDNCRNRNFQATEGGFMERLETTSGGFYRHFSGVFAANARL